MILSDFPDTTLPIVIHSQGWESLCEILVSCPTVNIQEFYSNKHGFNTSIPRFVTQVRGTRIVVTPDMISKMLHIPWVSHPNYPAYTRLRIVSKYKILSLFYEIPSAGGDH